MKRIVSVLILLSLSFFALWGAKKEKPLLIAGVLSDVHIINNGTTQQDSVFLKVLEFFRAQDVDAVIVAGDMVTDGVEVELERFSNVYFSVFPNDKGRKGKHVERIFVYGNHELEGYTYPGVIKRYNPEYLHQNSIAFHQEEFWEKYFHEPYHPFYRKEVKGYTFLASHYVKRGEAPGMAAWFEEQEGTFPPVDKPFFYIQHQHPKGTIPFVVDNGISTQILSKYPNVICFSGHCHSPLTDERSIWQGEFTSVNTASLSSVSSRAYRENSLKQKEGHVSQMKYNRGRLGHHGMIMKVYVDRVELHRYDFHNFLPLGVWTIPTDVTNRPYEVKKRTLLGAENPPQFTRKDEVMIEKLTGKNRNGERVKQIKVIFPVVVSHDGHPRAYDYRVSAERMAGDSTVVIMDKLVYSHHSYMNEKVDKNDGAWCVFAESELPQGVPFRFVVYPQDSFYNEGNPIFSKYYVL